MRVHCDCHLYMSKPTPAPTHTFVCVSKPTPAPTHTPQVADLLMSDRLVDDGAVTVALSALERCPGDALVAVPACRVLHALARTRALTPSRRRALLVSGAAAACKVHVMSSKADSRLRGAGSRQRRSPGWPS